MLEGIPLSFPDRRSKSASLRGRVPNIALDIAPRRTPTPVSFGRPYKGVGPFLTSKTPSQILKGYGVSRRESGAESCRKNQHSMHARTIRVSGEPQKRTDRAGICRHAEHEHRKEPSHADASVIRPILYAGSRSISNGS